MLGWWDLNSWVTFEEIDLSLQLIDDFFVGGYLRTENDIGLLDSSDLIGQGDIPVTIRRSGEGVIGVFKLFVQKI